MNPTSHPQRTLYPLTRALTAVTALFCCALLGVSGCSSQSAQEVPEISLPQGKADGPAPVRPGDCPGGAPKLVDGRPAAWTILVFQAGDNNLEDYLEEDLQEMELGYKNTPQVNVLVQQDREREDGVWRYELRHDNDLEVRGSELVGYSSDEPDTGSWQTLASFGQWATVCYPAENYVVVVSGHGTGWSEPEDEEDGDPIEWEDPQQDGGDGDADADAGVPEGDADTPDSPDGEDSGDATEGNGVSEDRAATEAEGEPYRAIAFDDTSGSSLDLQELSTALRFISDAARRDYDPPWMNRLVIYGSDACLMQTIEVIQALGDSVTYVVGSEKTEPGKGWPYSTILRELTQRPFAYARAPQKLAELIVDKYGDSYSLHGGQGYERDLTLSAVNLDHGQRLVNDVTKITTLLKELRRESELGEGLDDYIWAARRESPVFSETYLDLAEFLMSLRAQLIDAGHMPRKYQHWDGDERFRTLRNAIDEAVEETFEMTLANLDDAAPTPDGKADGVSVYFPDWKYSYVLSLEDYMESPFSKETGWGELVLALLETRYPY